jgi:acyl-CoA synthetase (AMP-forming)/AMP-acid ligase II
LAVRYYDWIAHFARRTPNKTAVVDLASDRRFTYAQLDARISRVATHLLASGFGYPEATASPCWRKPNLRKGSYREK